MEHNKAKPVITAFLVVMIGHLWISKGLAETLQAEGKTVFTTELQDVNLPVQTNLTHPQKANTDVVSRAESDIFYKMLLSVVTVFVLAIGVIYLSKKILPRFANLPGKQIKIVETVHIAPRKSLHIVQVGVRRFFIASTNEHITMLADISGSTTDFADELASKIKE